jgi:Na+-transporting NADH:ubiquinone oxidoreductase subunit A
VLRELDSQELLSFAMPGIGKRSYSRTVVGTLRTDMAMRYTTGLAGELRPCISCGLCADACPAGILPAVIHKQLYAGRIEEVQRLRVDLCIGCGLCSFVCPSKIDLRRELLNADAMLREEAALIRAEAEAAAAEAEALAAAEAAGEDGAEAREGAQ